MAILWSLLVLMGAHMLAVASPGPGFLAMVQTAVRNPRRIMLAHVSGMAMASGLWACSAIFGVQATIVAVPGLYRVLQLAGGLFLLWIGYKSWRGANKPLALPAAGGRELTARQAVWRGFSTNFANPKAMVFFVSIFTAVLRPDVPGWARIAAVCITIFDSLTLYSLFGTLLSTPRAQAGYMGWKATIDRTAGTVMLGFGLSLVASGLLRR